MVMSAVSVMHRQKETRRMQQRHIYTTERGRGKQAGGMARGEV